MLDSPVTRLLITCLLVVYQIGMFCWLGDLFARVTLRRSPICAGLPEYSFLAGCAVYVLAGYGTLIFATDTHIVPIAGLLACCGLKLLLRHRGEAPADQFTKGFNEFNSYFAFRKSSAGRFTILIICGLCAGVALTRLPWLIQLSDANTVSLGTHIWDDVRTIGYPISLAAHGYPLRNPYAIDTSIAYPLGDFIFTSGHITILPSLALPILLADTIVHAALYGTTLILIAGVIGGTRILQLLISLSSITSVSYNLWRLKPAPSQYWFQYFYGYYKSSGQYTTIGWTPFSGLIWVQNHALGFAAAVAAALFFYLSYRRSEAGRASHWPVCLVLASLAAVTSMDMAAMALSAAALFIVWTIFLNWRRGQPYEPWTGPAVGICAVVFTLLVLINFSSMVGKVDAPPFVAFPLVTSLRFNVGVLASTVGPYCALIFFACLSLRRSVWKHAGPFLLPLLVALGYSLVFEWHSIWFWRASFALHLLFAAVCGALGLSISRSSGRRVFDIYIALWFLILIPGAIGAAQDIYSESHRTPRINREVASIMEWIYHNTRLTDRVVAFQDTEGNLAPDVEYLRTGDRAGRKIFDRPLPLIGYRRYLNMMTDLLNGIASNDYIVYWRDRPEFDAILFGCDAPIVFANSVAKIYKIETPCRKKLTEPELRQLTVQYEGVRKQIEAQRIAIAQARDPLSLADKEIQQYFINNAADSALLRRKVEQYWDRRQYAQAIQFLAPIVQSRPESADGQYCLAYTYHLAHMSEEALEHYTKALKLGYSEFWVCYNRGAVYMELGDWTKAKRDLLRARELDPKHQGVQLYLKNLAKLAT